MKYFCLFKVKYTINKQRTQIKTHIKAKQITQKDTLDLSSVQVTAKHDENLPYPCSRLPCLSQVLIEIKSQILKDLYRLPFRELLNF